VVVEVVQLTYVKGNTSPVDRDSYCYTNLGCKSMLNQMEECCCRKSVIRIQVVRCWRVRLEKASSARSTKMQSCRTNANYRSESPTIQAIQENQPGVTKYRMSMPVAAVAKAERAAYHSHTAAVEGRDD